MYFFIFTAFIYIIHKTMSANFHMNTYSKGVVFSLFFLFLAGQSFGQDVSRKGIYVAPMLGIGIGSATGENFIESISEGADNIEAGLPAYTFGIHAGYMFTNKIGVMTGINIRHYSDEIDTYYNSSGMRKDIEIPFYFRVITSKPNRVGFFANAGVTPAFMIASGNESSDHSVYGIYGYDNGYNHNTLNVSAGVSFGLNIPMGNLGNIDLGPEIHAGIINCGTYYSESASNPYSFDAYNLTSGYIGLRMQCNFKVSK
jgi:hypothetical protein